MSGRIVHLDEIAESPVEVSWTNEPEIVLEVVHTIEPKITKLVVQTLVKTVTEPHRSGRVIEPLEWSINEIFILEEDEPVRYREAMLAPSSNEWLKAM